jgi:TonB family protein
MMTRLQRKCLIAVIGTHLLLVVALLCSGFVRPKPRPENMQLLDVIPSKAIDALFTSGVHDAQPPPPAPPVPTPQPPQPTPPPPTPAVAQVEPVKPPEPQPAQEQPQPEDNKPADVPLPKPPKKPHVVEPVLVKVTRPTVKQVDHSAEEAERAEKEAQKEAKRRQAERARAFADAATSIQHNASESTEVKMPGENNQSYASFGSIVVSVYHHHWIAPDNMAGESAVVSFTVTIARDGTVTSSHITSASGDSSVDRAVQRMLDRVTIIHPFPDDTTDRERTYQIDFNATRTSIQ